MAKLLRNALQSIRQNRLRSILAGFGIAWGILLLMVFLGIGNGFKAGVMSLFDAYAQKSLFVYGGWTSVGTSSTNQYTRILFDRSITDDIKDRYKSVVACSPEMSVPSITVNTVDESMTAKIAGVNMDYFQIKLLNVNEGRPLSHSDMEQERNVAVIGDGVKQTLFPKTNALNKYINVDGILFKVVGILASDDMFSMSERNSIYIPVSSFFNNYSTTGDIASFCLSLSSSASSTEIEKDLKGYLAFKYGFDPHDQPAVMISNIESQNQTFESLFNGLEILIWIIGICLLLSGIVGVCNVMLIIVKERTSEIGIRKAVGATSGSIIYMIMAESVTITVIAGLIGIAIGTCLIWICNMIVIPMIDYDLLSSLSVNIPVVVAAFVVLNICGVLAGLFPAVKASLIAPVDAIRYENRE